MISFFSIDDLVFVEGKQSRVLIEWSCVALYDYS